MTILYAPITVNPKPPDNVLERDSFIRHVHNVFPVLKKG